MKPRSILLILFGLVCTFWILRPRIAPPPEVASAKPAVASHPQTQPAPPPLAAPASVPEEQPRPKSTPQSPARIAENAISKILLASTSDHAATAARLIPLVLDPNFPAAQRTEALSHILNLSAGHERELLLPLVRDPRLTAMDCRALLDDALNQSPPWQREVYLAALGSRPESELRAYIRAHLSFLTGRDDLGDDPKAWVESLTQAVDKTPP